MSNEIEIIYQDQYYCIVNKPAEIPVHLSKMTTDDKSLLCILSEQMNEKLFPVHRLDRATSGLIVFARSSEACGALGKQFQEKTIQKTYQALVRGWIKDEDKIDYPIYKNPEIKKNRVDAITTYRCLERFEIPFSDGRFPTSRFSLAEIYPETGRTHQIRRHFRHIAHPLIGDTVYGKGFQNRLFREEFNSSCLMLAAVKLSFIHPYSSKKMDILAPPSNQFKNVISQLKSLNID